MRKIELSQGMEALVDDGDYESLRDRKWCYQAVPGPAPGYAVCSSERPRITMHRAIMNPQKGQDVDHINSNGLDNRRANLRLATRSQNLRNSRLPKSNTSGFKGVWKQGDNWVASIRVEGKTRCLGTFLAPEDAARAYDRSAIEIAGEFARTNADMGLL